MNGKTLYHLVYSVVKDSLAKNQPKPGLEKMFQWAKKVPPPGLTSAKLAEALCVSVLRSGEIGLECFFQEMVSIDKLRQILNPIYVFTNADEVQLSKIPAKDSKVFLGHIVRSFLVISATYDENYEELLNL